MISTSAEYKEKILKNRILHHEARIEFADGTTLAPTDAELYTFKISDNTSSQNSFDIGAVIANQLELKINNIDGEYSKHNFSGAKITTRVGLELSEEKTEWLKKGVFYAQPGTFTDDTVNVTATDSMTKFDTSYSKSNLQYPATLGQIVRDACDICDVAMSADIASFPQDNFVVATRPADTSITFRQILQHVGEIACLFFKINADDKLTAAWYNTALLDLEEPEEIEKNEEVVKVEDYTGTIETDDVVITGIKVTEENASGTDGEKTGTEYIYGSTGYVLEIKENKLIQEGKGGTVAESVGKKLNGITFRPLTIKCLGNPAVEAGDIAIVTDRKGRKYKTILTGVTYTAKASQELLCGAETPEQLSATRYSKATQVYRELRKQITQQRSEFSKAVEQLRTAMDEKQGLYPVTEKQEDGSSILYFCDKPTRKESKVVIELNARGWGMSTDGGKTWNAGTLVDGTTITKILNTIGINANWINTGALTVKDNTGDTVLSINTDTGKLVTKMAEIGGWNVDDKRIYKDVIVNSNNYRVYLQPPNEDSGENTWVFSVQKKINNQYVGLMIIRADGSLMSNAEDLNRIAELKNAKLNFYKDGKDIGGIGCADSGNLEIRFTNIGQSVDGEKLKECHSKHIFKSYGNTEITTNAITKAWKELYLTTNVGKQNTGFCSTIRYSEGYDRVKIKKKGVYHFAVRVVTRCPSAYKRVFVAPAVNGERYSAYTDTECSIAANLECQTLKNYTLELEEGDEVGITVSSQDGVAFYVKIQDMNILALDYEGKYSY